ncbi:recombinase RecT [Methylobacterium indicum]|uniref:recombinase RecT n=1 Tax=Methylobacterium indicum TaxID=1775910 RepID=UPI00069EB90B|nr:recombinase RecT [Methylobacterium indicum]
MSSNTAVAVQGAHPAVASLGTGAVMAIVPQTFDDVFRFSQVLARSGLCPHGMDTPEKVSVAILTGLEIGVKPMQAVQGIAVIGGRPCIWGDLALGIVRGSGALEYIRETYEGDESACDWTATRPEGAMLDFKAVCRVKRVGQPEIVTEFSVRDAVVAKLWGKRGYNGKDTPWITNPKRMIKMRARGFGLRDGFADALKGLYIAEEMIGTDADTPMDPAPPLPPPVEDIDMRRAKAAVIEHKPAAPVAPAPEQPASHVPRGQAQAVVADPAAAASNFEEGEPRPGAEILAEAKTHLDNARSIGDVADIRALYADDEEHLTRSERETFQHLCEEAEARLQNPATVPFGKPVEPAEAPETARTHAAAETPQEPAVEDWAAYAARIRRLADATHTPDQADGLHKVWTAGKGYRSIMHRENRVSMADRKALTKVVEEALNRATADTGPSGAAPAPANPEGASAPVAPGLSAITADASEAVRACGERIFSALSTAPTKERAFVIWSRSQRDRDECGASAEVLAAWTKEYQAIRKNLPEEA